MRGNSFDIFLYIIILIIPILAQIKVTKTYSKFKKVHNKNKLSGFEVARKILDANGLDDIYVVETPGNLTDHYDPSRKVVKLSTDVLNTYISFPFSISIKSSNIGIISSFILSDIYVISLYNKSLNVSSFDNSYIA